MSINPPTDAAIVAALAEVQAELHALRDEVRQLRRPDGPSTAERELVIAIREHVKDTLFNAVELLEHARLPQASALASAIVAAAGAMNGRKLGQRLKKLEGVACDGLEVVRVSSDRDGVVWRVSQT